MTVCDRYTLTLQWELHDSGYYEFHPFPYKEGLKINPSKDSHSHNENFDSQVLPQKPCTSSSRTHTFLTVY